MNEVVITGIGLVTPLGLGREQTWQALLQGQSGIAPDLVDTELLSARVRNVPVVHDGRLLALSFLAAAEAVRDAELDLPALPMERFGCTVSVSKPNLGVPGKLSVNEAFYPSMLGEQLYRIFKLRGPLRNIGAACATGADSVILAAQMIQNGECDIAFAGATESPFHPLYQAGFKKMGVLAEHKVCPFDRGREGFALGEGSAVFVLERKEYALFRGATKLYGELSGWAMSNDAYHPVAFKSDGAIIAQAIRLSLEKAGIETVEYLNAHGTATKLNDVLETRAIKKAFGASAPGISVSSTKAATGHLLGASGAVELGFCLLALRDQFVPPTLNLTVPDPDCDLDYTSRGTRRRHIDHALSLSFGFGGQITSTIVSRPGIVR